MTLAPAARPRPGNFIRASQTSGALDQIAVFWILREFQLKLPQGFFIGYPQQFHSERFKFDERNCHG
jgi:hypothetical protein